MTEEIAPEQSGFATLREAIRGSEQDYTTAPLRRSVFLLAVPMILEMSMESIFAVTDIFFVSRLGADAVATVGLTESMLAIVYTIAMGLGMGVSAMVARRIGEKNPDEAAHTAAQGVLIALILAVVMGITGAILAPVLLGLMHASPEVIATGSHFTRIMLGGEATIMLLFLLNAAFRGAGDAAIAMRVLWISNAINIVLGPCLIFGVGPLPALGVTGAAIATTFGRGVGAVLAFRALIRPGGRLPVKRHHFTPDLTIIRSILKLSSSVTLQFLIGSGSWIVLTRIMANFGSTALAGYTVAMRIVVFAILPAWGLANAAATLVGQNLGARRPDRAEAAVWTACRYNLAFLGVLGVVFLAAAPLIVSWFGHDLVMAAYAVRALRIVAIGFPLYAFGMVLTQAFNGAGDSRTPTWLNFLVFWVWEIPLAWFLAHTLGLGPTGPVIAIAVAFSTLAGAATVLFRRGTWKLGRV